MEEYIKTTLLFFILLCVLIPGPACSVGPVSNGSPLREHDPLQTRLPRALRTHLDVGIMSSQALQGISRKLRLAILPRVVPAQQGS